MTITAAMVKELRELTGAGMMECKKALQETEGDIKEAIDVMRKRGQAKAAKRAGKIAAEGLIAIQNDASGAFMAEVNCETDFVAKDATFLQFVETVSTLGLENKINEVQALLDLNYNDNETVEQARQQLIHKIGENVNVRRLTYLGDEGHVGSYVHGGRIGVLVALDVDNNDLAKDVAMHIAASNPNAISEKQLDQSLVEKEREILTAQAKESGKPDDIIGKMVQGRINKFIKEICLVDQAFVKNPDQTVGQLLKQHNANVIAFTRYEVGEGIEKETVDFAEEVKAQVSGS